MSKSLPVYELGQWIKSDRNIGYVVARMSAANVWEVREDYANPKDVERFSGRGAGYVIQWVEVLDIDGWTDDLARRDPFVPHSTVPYRLSWLRAETIAEKRYQPCENPVKAPAKYETFDPPSDDANDGVTAIAFDADGKGHVVPEPSQPALLLDIEAHRVTEERWCGGAEDVVKSMLDAEDAAIEIMRTVVAAGKKAEAWLIAKGLTL